MDELSLVKLLLDECHWTFIHFSGNGFVVDGQENLKILFCMEETWGDVSVPR